MLVSVLKDIWVTRNIFIAVFTPILLLPLQLIGNTQETKCAYVVILVAVYWITEALPIAVTSLLPVVLFPVVGIMNAKDVSAEYFNDTSMLFVGGLIVAAAIEHWGIHKRIALRILMIVGSEPHWLLLGMMLPTWFLSMWISNTATTAMMIPIANAVLLQLKTAKTTNTYQQNGVDNFALNVNELHEGVPQGQESGKEDLEVNNCVDDDANKESEEGMDTASHNRMCKALSLAIAYSANVGGIGSLTGTGPNVVMKGQSEIVFEKHGGQSPVTFASWMQFGLPLSAILLVVLWLWMLVYFLRCKPCFSCCKKKNTEISKRVSQLIKSEYKKLGPVTFGQGAILGHFIALAVLWIFRDLGGVGGWGDIFPEKTVSDSTPSILVASSLFLFPSAIPRIFCCKEDRKRNYEPLLPWHVAEKKVPWGVVLLLGGGFALAKSSEKTGLSAWLGDQLTVFSSLEPWLLILILCYIVAAATEVTSNTATCTLLMPIMAQLAQKLSVNPLYIMFPTAIATSFAFMLPVATPPNAVVFSYGYLNVIDMVTAGFLMNIISVPILVGATETWGNSIFNFHTLPSIFQNTTISNASSVTI